jgi:hypothetical protein
MLEKLQLLLHNGTNVGILAMISFYKIRSEGTSEPIRSIEQILITWNSIGKAAGLELE